MKINCLGKKIVDKKYIELVYPLLKNKKVRQMDKFIQHGNTSTLQHSINVSYISYKLARKFNLDYESVACATILHDFYLYDWHDEIPEEIDRLGKHAFYHPKVALKNALTVRKLNKLERDIIMRHMWPVTIVTPKFKESWLVSFVDKYCAIYESLIEHL